MELRQLNQLQMPTWHWLNINQAEPVEGMPGNYKLPLHIENGEQLQVENKKTTIDAGRLPADVRQSLAATAEHAVYERVITLGENLNIEQPVIFDFQMDHDNDSLFDLLQIKAEKGSSATFVLRYTSAGDEPCFHRGFTSLEVAPGAEVKLILAQMLSEADRNIGTVAVTVAENGLAEVLLGELGAAQTVGSCNIELAGKKSRGELNGLYIGADDQKRDFSYRIGFRGKESEGQITVRGALAGRARKVMKSTIDFTTGAAGAKGREEETVLALSDQVVNLSAPLLLCGEDNVEGEHATTTGKPDEGKLYYLMSRGLTEAEAKKLIVEASFTPLLNKVEPEQLKGQWRERIQGVMHSD